MLSGHQHEGGFFTDQQTGIHFVVLEAPVNSKKEKDKGPFLTVELGPTHGELRGYGNTIDNKGWQHGKLVNGSPIFPDSSLNKAGEPCIRRLKLPGMRTV